MITIISRSMRFRSIKTSAPGAGGQPILQPAEEQTRLALTSRMADATLLAVTTLGVVATPLDAIIWVADVIPSGAISKVVNVTLLDARIQPQALRRCANKPLECRRALELPG